MLHQSMLQHSGSLYSEVKAGYARGPLSKPRSLQSDGTHAHYSNLGFNLLRILLTSIIGVGGIKHWTLPGTDDDEGKNFVSSLSYYYNVKRQILERCGIPADAADVYPIGKHPAFYYALSAPPEYAKYVLIEEPSWTEIIESPDSDAILRAGAGWWHLSSTNVGRFLAGLSHGRLFSRGWWRVMRDNYLTFGGPEIWTDPIHYEFSYKGVTFPWWSKAGFQSSASAHVLLTPDDVAATLLSNTNPGPNLFNVLQSSYLAALP
jgi:hypothetical protein